MDSIYESKLRTAAIDVFLDSLKAMNDNDGCDILDDLFFWSFIKPKDRVVDFWLAVVGRIKSRVSDEPTLPTMWQDPLMIALDFLPDQKLKEMLEWYGEGEDWASVIETTLERVENFRDKIV